MINQVIDARSEQLQVHGYENGGYHTIEISDTDSSVKINLSHDNYSRIVNAICKDCGELTPQEYDIKVIGLEIENESLRDELEASKQLIEHLKHKEGLF